MPRIAPDDLCLQIGGMVGQELRLSLHELQASFATREIVATLQCAGNQRAAMSAVRDIPGEAPWGPGATGTARWTGVALRDVLLRAEVDPAARHVAFIAGDRCEEATPAQDYGASIPLARRWARKYYSPGP